MKRKTIIEIANHCHWKDVKRAHKYFYPYYSKPKSGVLERLEEIFEEIRKYTKVKVDPKEYIEVSYINDFDIGMSDDAKEEGYFSIATNEYSMSFRPWKKLANLKVKQSNMTNAIIMAHFLFEITYYGYEKEQMKKIGKGLETDYKNCVKQLDKEKKKK